MCYSSIIQRFSFIEFGNRLIKYNMAAAFIGSAIGTLLVQFINTKILSFIIPVILVLIAAYFLLSPKPVEINRTAKMSKRKYRFSVVPAIGCYDGMFGPGTGSFFALGGVALQGQGLIDATATAKSLNFATNIASVIVFIVAGKIFWPVGLIMMCGQFIGAWLGSHSLLRIRPHYLRYLVVTMCLGMLVKYAVSML